MEPSHRCPFLPHNGTHHHQPFLLCPHHHHHHPLFFHHHHNHYHHHFSPQFGLHNLLFCPANNSHICPAIASPPPVSCLTSQNPQTNMLNFEVSESKEANNSAPLLFPEEGEEGLEEVEEEEEPLFVLTEEWMEFFAKSEAKRRLAKKQAKKKGKN